MRAVALVFARNVPRGKSFRRGVAFIDRVYRVRVPGKEKSMAAVAWCRKSGESLKYMGIVATYVRTETTVRMSRVRGWIGRMGFVFK